MATSFTERAVRGVARRLGVDLTPDALAAYPDDVRAIIDFARPYTMTSPQRLAALIDAARHVAARGIAGDVVECGVWKGGSSIAAMRALLAAGDTTRDFYLYDTFEGMSEPTEHDREAGGGAAAADMLAVADKSEVVWAFAGLDEVRANVARAGYPAERVHFVQGKVEDTIPATIPERIAILRLDTDWYESTAHELEHLYPRLVPGGVLIIDDYGHWEGARKAVDEYFARDAQPLLLNRIDYTGRMAIKA